MSKGPGRIQQRIAALIRAHPEGAWTTAVLCRHVYDLPADDMSVEKKHRVAVIRAIRQMKLPPLWGVQKAGMSCPDDCLYNAGSLESTLRKECYGYGWDPTVSVSFKRWKRDYPNRIEEAQKEVAEVRRYHEASPVEKIDIDIAVLQRSAQLWAMGGVASQVKIATDRAELQARKAKLLASQG